MLEASCHREPAGPDTHTVPCNFDQIQHHRKHLAGRSICLTMASKALLKVAYLTDIKDTKGKAQKMVGCCRTLMPCPSEGA